MTDEQKKFNDYAKFVISTTSEESLSTFKLAEKLVRLGRETNTEWSQLLTASIGMQAESGEFSEVIKKIIFQGKPYNEDERYHLKRELGDVLWYWIQGCIALGYEPEEVMKENIKKLESRYPNGFEIARSEKREEGDI